MTKMHKKTNFKDFALMQVIGEKTFEMRASSAEKVEQVMSTDSKAGGSNALTLHVQIVIMVHELNIGQIFQICTSEKAKSAEIIIPIYTLICPGHFGY